MKLSETIYANILEKNFETALHVQNRYKFVNMNLFPYLTETEKKFMLELEEAYIKFLPEVQKNLDDIYVLFPKIPIIFDNINNYSLEDIRDSSRLQFFKVLTETMVAPELSWAYGASDLCIRALFHNNRRSEIQEKALEELIKGKKIGGMGITEPKRGSDAVNMECQAFINPNKTISYNGVKIFTTNGAVADYFTTYGVLNHLFPRQTMMLTLFLREDDGLSTERIKVGAAEPGVGIGKVTYNHVTVSPDRMIAPPGEGYRRLFRGLTPERLGIVSQSLAFIWDALAHGVLFSQLRYQFENPIFTYQGISNVLTDIFAKASAYTAFHLQNCDFYDNKVLSKIKKNQIPNRQDEEAVALNAAQAKLLTGYEAHKSVYEVIQLMGGRGSISEYESNNQINRLENLSRILEVTGGHRNIQRLIVGNTLKSFSKAIIKPQIDAEKHEFQISKEKTLNEYIHYAEELIRNEKNSISDEYTIKLTNILQKIKNAEETDQFIEMEVYGGSLVKLVNEINEFLRK